MKVLFLDDMKERHRMFFNHHGHNFDIIPAYSYAEFVRLIREHEFGMLFLDHDLSETAIMCDPDDIDEKTGTDAALFIVQTIDPASENAPGIVLHSLNPLGRKRMFQILSEAGFDVKETPFHVLCPAKIR